MLGLRIRYIWGQPRGQVVKVARSAAAAQGFAGSCSPTRHCSSGYVEAASHMPQLEGPAAKIYSYVPGGWGRKSRKIKKKIERLATIVSSGADL